jgi:uncharacterized protein (DUF1499 family)
MRRHLPREPWSQAALWSRHVALFAATVAMLATILARLRAIDPASALASLGAAVGLSLVALLLFAAACFVIWQTGRRGMGVAAMAALIAILTLAWPGYLAFQALRLPTLSDIVTDLDDPPYFSMSRIADAARDGFQPRALSPRARAAQRTAYPDVEPIVIDLDADEALPLVLKTAKSLGWRLIDQRPAGGRTGDAHADFIDQSLILGLDEDITVRLRPLAGQTRIDLRAATRHGRHDFGANARRIEAFAEELQSQLDNR